MSEPEHCKDFGADGDRVELHDLPKGKICTLMGFAQTAAREIKVEVIGGGRTVAEISKKGNATEPTPLLTPDGSPVYRFKIEHEAYHVKVSSSEGQVPRVLIRPINVSHGNRIYAAGYMLAAEDHPEHGDCDFNDCVAYLTWTDREG